MSVKNVVKVMNFHALLRVNDARERVVSAIDYENKIKAMIALIINNRNFMKEKKSIKLNDDGKELNIYIGSDYGFCSSFNSDVLGYAKNDDSINDKIVIGRKIDIKLDNVILSVKKEDFLKKSEEIIDIVLDGLYNKKYSRINVIYIHYENVNVQYITKKMILPIDFSTNIDEKESYSEDFTVEGDINYILWNLVAFYVQAEIVIAEALSWAAENVERQNFTNESLKKIEEREDKQKQIIHKEKMNKVFKEIVETNNKKRNNLDIKEG